MTPQQALQSTLAAEHAAVYVLATVGAQARPGQPELAERVRAAYTAHRARRDRLRSQIADAGAVPVAAAAGYDVALDGTGEERLERAAREIEERCATVYAQLVAASTGPTRAWAVNALIDSAVRSLSLGAAPTAYPGASELG